MICPQVEDELITVVRQSLADDLEGEKRYVGRQKFCRMMIMDLLMKSADVCISIPVRNMAIQSSAKYSKGKDELYNRSSYHNGDR